MSRDLTNLEFQIMSSYVATMHKDLWITDTVNDINIFNCGSAQYADTCMSSNMPMIYSSTVQMHQSFVLEEKQS